MEERGKREFNGRASGRSTRLVDFYIQELFKNKGCFIKVIDHHPTHKADLNLLHMITSRLDNEHPWDFYTADASGRIKLN